MAQKDVKEINRQTGQVKKGPRFDEREWKWVADYVVSEYDRRKRNRSERERHWKEIDRQIAMEPSIEFKLLPGGQIDDKKKWMAETELPLQAQALEVLTSDARRMMFSDSGPWFRAHAQVTDEYLAAIEGHGGVKVLGDDNYIPSLVNQDNADKIVEGYLLSAFRQYDHHSRFDIINAESFKYGVGIGRGRLERKNIWINEARGVRSEKKLVPTIVPCSIKNIYLEETRPSLHSSTVLGPAHIAVDNIKYENIAMAANKGSNNPDDPDGGWMPAYLKKVNPDKQGYVKILEMEGDIVIPRKTVKSITIPGAIITVAVGGSEKGMSEGSRAVIRFRFRKYSFGSYLLFPYMAESADEVYATGPLMKGRTVQQTATDAVNNFLDSAALKKSPPLGYDRSDPYFAQTGAPEVYPTAIWGSIEPVRVHADVGGDPGAMAQAALQFINLYAELTGVLPARVGAQTRSHTTATAKQFELQRGSARTVDYVNSIGHGPLTNWLYMAYAMGRDALSSNEKLSLFIESYGGWIEIDKSMLPDADFEWFGAGGPQEKQQRQAARINALVNAVKIDQLRMSMGMPPRLNLDSAVDEILREGGWDDISNIVNTGGASPGPSPPPGVPGTSEGNPGAAVAAIQNLATGTA